MNGRRPLQLISVLDGPDAPSWSEHEDLFAGCRRVPRATAGAGTRMEVTRDGMRVAVQDTAQVARLLTSLAEHSSVNSTSYAGQEAGWKAASAAPSRIHIWFADSRRMRLIDVDTVWRHVPVREVLLVVRSDAWPDHVLLHTDTGFQAVTKYSPCEAMRLSRKSDLAVLDREKTRYGMPYEKLCP